VKTYKIADGNGYEEELEPGTTKQEAELIMANLPGWSLTVTGNDDTKPARQRRKSAYGKRNRHGFWPTTSAIPRESSRTSVRGARTHG
jgi:hypothetical protein